MKNTWLVIANRTNAYIYQLEKNAGMFQELPLLFRDHPEPPLIKTFSHPEGKMRDQDLVSDGEGHYKASATAHGKYSEHSPRKEIEANHFAQEIVDFLEKEHNHQAYHQLLICAEPHFYGVLNKALSHHLAPLVREHILKDYVPLHGEGLRKVIEEIQTHL